MNKHPVTIWPEGTIIEMNESDSLYEQLKKAGFNIKSTCGGCASCGQCTVVITTGEENLNEPSFEEKQLIGNVFHITKERLSCQTKLTGSLTVDISAHKDMPKIESSSKTIKRSKEEAEAVVAQRREASAEKRKTKTHKLGGGKKPKPFNFSDEDFDKKS